MTILSKLGLMKRSEHEDRKLELDQAHQDLDDMTAERDALQFKFTKAIKDLAEQSDEIAVLKDAVEQSEAQADQLRPDATLWRNARAKRSRDRKAAKGGVK